MEDSAGAFGMFYNAAPRRQIAILENLEAMQALPPSTARLPHEDEHSAFAFADNVGRSVVSKACGSSLFVTMQWRHDTPWADERSSVLALAPNHICRVHLIEQHNRVDRLATVHCPSTGLLGVHSLSMGRFAIGMNSNLYSSRPWTVPSEFVGVAALDLMTGAKHASVEGTVRLAANQTMVLFAGSE